MSIPPYFRLPLYGSGSQPANDASLKQKREKNQRQRRQRGSRGDLAPRHGVFAGKKSDAHRKGLAIGVGQDNEREEEFIPSLNEDQQRGGENSRRRHG